MPVIIVNVPYKDPRRLRRIGRIGLCIAAIGPVLAVIAIVFGVPDGPDQVVSEATVVTCAEMDREGTPYDENAPAYTGDGPHSTILIRYRDFDPQEDALWLPLLWEPDITESPQLVVCELTVSTGDTLGSCTYERVSVSVVAARYQYKIFEARTGRTVAEFTVQGVEGCPPNAPSRISNGDALPQDSDMQTLENLLRPYVEGSLQ